MTMDDAVRAAGYDPVQLVGSQEVGSQNAMHLICTCNATYTVKEAVSTLYSHVYTVHAHYMYAVNTCIAQLKTYSEIQPLQDYH